MRKDVFSKLVVAVSVFLAVSSAAAPVLADNFTTGGGTVQGITGVNGGNPDADIAIGTNSSASGVGSIAIGSSDHEYSSGAVAGNEAIAIGSGSTAQDYAVAVGTGSSANTYGTAVGVLAKATGEAATALGWNAQASGKNSTALGASASATAEGATAIGYGSTASGVASTANGMNSVANGDYSAAFGTGAKTSAAYSTALGAGASATAANSVALGYNSVADRANTVSVGSVGNERQITNVADGTADTDAANMSQVRKVGAMAAAISGLTPMPYDGKTRLQILAGGGEYDGWRAFALGVGYYARDSLMLTGGMAFCGSERMVRLGLTWKLGHAANKETAAAINGNSDMQMALRQRNVQIVQMQNQLQQQQEQSKRQQEQNKEQQAQIKQLQDQVKELLQTQVWRD